MEEILKKVAEQADDEGLWFIARTAPEAYLQAAIRELHRLIEAKQGESNKGSVVLSLRGSSALREYLKQHEDHIAWGINDFGELKGLFIEVFGRSPKHHTAKGE